MPRYVPERGDIVWFTFDPQAGREQAGRRPALVSSPALYNRRASLALVCLTSHVKGYPSKCIYRRDCPLVVSCWPTT